MRSVITTRKHQTIHELSYRKSITFVQFCTCSDNRCCISTDGNESRILYFKPFKQLQNNIKSHDFSQTSTLSSFLFHFTKQQRACLLIKNSPCLSTAMRSRFVHQNFSQANFLSRNIFFFQLREGHVWIKDFLFLGRFVFIIYIIEK